MRTIVCLLVGAVCAANVAAQTARINQDESKVPEFTLPEILVSESGQRISTVEEWETVRKPEILSFFSENVYGETPEERIPVKWTVLSEIGDALDCKATFRQVLFTFGNPGRTVDAILLLLIPNKKEGPVPAFVSYNFNGNHSICDDQRIYYPPIFHKVKAPDDISWERGNQKSRWNLDMIVDAGYALATMCYHDICPDNPALRDCSIASLFSGFNRNMQDYNEWGAIGAWAWGLSRIADYLETVDEIDASRLAVMGHSRQGKAAIWAGAQDERFKVVISNESGCTGAALSKRVFGENLSWITSRFGYWFCPAYRQYAGREEALPYDQHQLLAVIAPRHLYVSSAEEDKWSDPKGEFLAAYHAGEVYELYGLKGLADSVMPEIHHPVHCDVAYHVRAGKHDVTDYDWSCYLDYCDKYL